MVPADIWPHFTALTLVGEFNPNNAAEALVEWASQRAHSKIYIIAETSGMDHTPVDELPDSKESRLRQVFMKLAGTNPEIHFAAANSEILGWSMEPTWASGPLRKTMVHAESTPCLRIIVDRMTSANIKIHGAYSWYSICSSIVNAKKDSNSKSRMGLAIGANGMSYACIEPAQRRAGGFAPTENIVESMPNFLDEFGMSSDSWSSGLKPVIYALPYDTEGTKWITELVAHRADIVEITPKMMTAAIKAQKSLTNLLEPFPKIVNLNQALLGVSALFVVISLAICYLTYTDIQGDKSLARRRAIDTQSIQDSIKSGLERKTKTMELEETVKVDTFILPRGKADFLSKLGKSFPMECTLTRLEINAKGDFIIEGFIVQEVNNEAITQTIDSIKHIITGKGIVINDNDFNFSARNRTFTANGTWKQ